MITFLLFVTACLISAVIGMAYLWIYNASELSKLGFKLLDKERELKNIRALHCQKNSEASKRIGEVTEKWRIVCKILRRACKRLKECRKELRDQELNKRAFLETFNEQGVHVTNLNAENETLRQELRAREKMIDTLESQFVKANVALETVKGAVDHHFHNEDGS